MITYDPVQRLLARIIAGTKHASTVLTRPEQLLSWNAPRIYHASAYGAKADGSTDDQAAIQAAMDDANSDGGGTVILPPGTVAIESSILVKRYCRLLIPPETTLKPTSDINAVNLKPGGAISGGGIIALDALTTEKAAIYLDGAYVWAHYHPTIIHDITIQNLTNQRGYGIHAYAGASDNDNVTYTQTSHIHFTNLTRAIYLQAVAPASGGTWVNENTFTNIVIAKCTQGIVIEGDTPATNVANGNAFVGVQCQIKASTTTDCIKVDGYRNIFIGFRITDPADASGTDLVHFQTNSQDNTAIIGTTETYIRDDGTDNFIIATEDNAFVNRPKSPAFNFTPQTAAPSSPSAGTVAYADGSSWNPGSGAGLYVYDGTSWNKL